MWEAERAAFRTTFVLSRPTLRATMAVAAVYALQATGCVVALYWGYDRTGYPGVTWAVVSAILALQPGLHQSVVTSVVRVLANTVGAGVALAVGHVGGRLGPVAGTVPAQVAVSIAVVVFACELLRLGQALRTACVAAVIVLSANHMGQLSSSAEERFAATVIGCGTALAAQVVTDLVGRSLPRRSAT